MKALWVYQTLNGIPLPLTQNRLHLILSAAVGFGKFAAGSFRF
jgi:hypothetical protein